ncbi:Uncharacterised protein [Mycobacterium tuberculosis]|nr:Uncharacterised protein [Mycobacterium tuberculosis]
MDLIQRDTVQLQPPRTGALAVLDHRRKRRDREDLASHHHLGAVVAEGLPENTLAFAQAVDLGGIEQRDPQGACAFDNVAGGAGGVPVPISPFTRAELPSAQPDPADLSDSVDVQTFHVCHRTEGLGAAATASLDGVADPEPVISQTVGHSRFCCRNSVSPNVGSLSAPHQPGALPTASLRSHPRCFGVRPLASTIHSFSIRPISSESTMRVGLSQRTS